jgi:putative Mg2+ transporter-C (MgtC) family protein
LSEALTLEPWELVLRVLAAAALGGAIGFEREFADQPAGFRTHILVALGAALFTLVGSYGVEPFVGEGSGVRFDPTRVAAQVVTGIGFLGAGAILQQGVNVRGLTTAASLWVTAAIGTAVALGYWSGAIATTATTLLALWGLKRVSHGVFRRLRGRQRSITVDIGPEVLLSQVAHAFDSAGVAPRSLQVVADEEGNRTVVIAVDVSDEASADELAARLRGLEGVRSVTFEP